MLFVGVPTSGSIQNEDPAAWNDVAQFAEGHAFISAFRNRILHLHSTVCHQGKKSVKPHYY